MALPKDARSDLGIARLGKKPRIRGYVGSNSWPFVDEYEDFSYSEEEEQMRDKIQKKTAVPVANYNDHGMDRSALHDIIKVEVATLKGLSPFPKMYKNRDGHLGRSAKSIANTHALGFYADYDASGHNYKGEPLHDDEEPAYTLQDIALKQLRECIRLILLEYYEQV